MSNGTYNDDPRGHDDDAQARASASHGPRGGADGLDTRIDPDSSQDVELGSILDERYVLKAHLGTGRYGEIYDAIDRSLSDPLLQQEQHVALHLLHARIAQQTRLLQKLEASYQEPHLWSQANTVKVRGFGCDRGRYFLVMELLEGATLRAFLDATPSQLPSATETFAVLRGAGAALTYAHGKGAVHGDIRPETIFITSDAVIKVPDLLPASSQRTRAFFVEDANGLAAPDPRDDVYGLACVAYELLAGRHPFDARSPLEVAHAGLVPAPIPRLDAEVWAALARALALRREQRTPNVAAFLAELGVTGEDTQRSVNEPMVREPPPRDEPVLERPRARDDDMPIIGDYSDGADYGPRRAPSMAIDVPPPVRPHSESGAWRIDPRDVNRYAERTRRRDGAGPSGGIVRFAVVVLVLAAAGVAVWKYEPLRTRAQVWVALARAALQNAPPSAARQPSASTELETVTVAPPVVIEARDIAPDVVDAPPAGDRSAAVSPAAAAPPVDSPARAATEERAPEPRAIDPSAGAPPAPPAPEASERPPVAAAEPPPVAAAEPPPPVPAPEPPPPPAPETLEFVAPFVSVSESQAGATITIRRRGGTQGESTFVWWTSDGTATAGNDYADLGTIAEKFAPGEVVHAIHVPIVGDSTREGVESFYVNIGTNDRPRGGSKPPQRVEVVITDDD